MSNKVEFNNQLFFHPGYYIREIIDDRNMTQKEFAHRLEVTEKNLSDLINGKALVSNRIASRLSNMLGTSVEVWLNLQKDYDSAVLELEREKEMKQELEYFNDIDHDYFLKLGVVGENSDKIELLKAYYNYFAVSSLGVMTTDVMNMHYNSNYIKDKQSIFAANIWIQTVLNFGEQTVTGPYNQRKLKQSITEARKLIGTDPALTFPVLQERLTAVGVALIPLSYLKWSNVNGVVRWISKEKAVVGIVDRHIDLDKFWRNVMRLLEQLIERKTTKTIIDYVDNEQSLTYKNIQMVSQINI